MDRHHGSGGLPAQIQNMLYVFTVHADMLPKVAFVTAKVMQPTVTGVAHFPDFIVINKENDQRQRHGFLGR
nr:hypothetical protein [uncultured Chitinophaga sp.]